MYSFLATVKVRAPDDFAGGKPELTGMQPTVVHFVPSLGTGGLERLVYNLVTTRGVDRTPVVCLKSLGHFGEELRKQGGIVEVMEWAGGWASGSASAIGRLCRYLHRVRADVLHCHTWLTHFYGAPAAFCCGGIPVVMTRHGTSLPTGGLWGALNRGLMRFSQGVGVSEEIASVMRDWIPKSARPVLSVTNGVSLTEYERLPSRSAARAALGWSAHRFFIGIVARLVDEKGHDCLLEAASILRSKAPEASVVIVGDGPIRERLAAAVKARDLSDVVRLLGQRHDVPRILAALDVFVLPSQWEGTSLAVLEAMAARLPIVASNVGGNPDVVMDGETGLLIPPGDPGRRLAKRRPWPGCRLAEALLALRNDPERARRMGQAGRLRVEREFSIRRSAERYERIYESLLAK
jgi:glycosyltransferase involved in cell wall biosynthesis